MDTRGNDIEYSIGNRTRVTNLTIGTQSCTDRRFGRLSVERNETHIYTYEYISLIWEKRSWSRRADRDSLYITSGILMGFRASRR